MTHPHSKRLPAPGCARPGHGRVVAAVLGPVAALRLGAVGEAQAWTRGSRSTGTSVRERR